MLDFYQKRKLRAVANARVTQVVLALLATLLIWNAFERYVVSDTVRQRQQATEQAAAALQARKDTLDAQVRYLQDERGIEAEVRRQFDIALPGEEVVVILEDEPEPAIEPLGTTTEAVARWWWPF